MFDVPGNILPEGNYVSKGSFSTYDSLESYKKTKSEGVGVTGGEKSYSGANDIAGSVLSEEEQKSLSESAESAEADSSYKGYSKAETSKWNIGVEGTVEMKGGKKGGKKPRTGGGRITMSCLSFSQKRDAYNANTLK